MQKRETVVGSCLHDLIRGFSFYSAKHVIFHLQPTLLPLADSAYESLPVRESLLRSLLLSEFQNPEPAPLNTIG